VDASNDIALDAQFDFTATGPFGITLGNNNIGIGPSNVTGIPLGVTLERLGGNPGTGSRVELPSRSGLQISLPAQPPSNFGSPGCEVDASVGCALDVQSVDVTLQDLTLSNISGMIVADQQGVVIPEPSTLALLGLGVGGLWVATRRSKRS